MSVDDRTMQSPVTGPDRTGYAICTVRRSGSNWLGQLMSSTDMLGRPLEYFNVVGRRMFDDPDYPDAPAAQVERILSVGATSNGVYGLKLFPKHLDRIAAQLRWTEALPNLRFIHFERQDLLGQALSAWRVSKTQRFRSSQPRAEAPAYDGGAILEHLRSIVVEQARWALFFATNAIAPLHLTYEQVMLDPQAACEAVGRLVGLDDRPVADLSRVDLQIQRDESTDSSRRRFIAEFGDADRIAAL